MLKICFCVALVLALGACGPDYEKEMRRQDKLNAAKDKIKDDCRRDLGSCTLYDTCGGLQLNIEGQAAPDIRIKQDCEARWHAATSR